MLGKEYSMANTGNNVHRPQSGKLPLIPEESAFETLLRTAEKLSNADRQRFIKLLLKHAFLDEGVCYLRWEKWNLRERQTAYRSVLKISDSLAKPWFIWASALSNEGSSYCAQERIICLIRGLTKQISVKEMNRWLNG
jgi:hypothetical protein